MKSTLIATAIAALFGLVDVAQAQVVNPDNDSATFFRSVPLCVTPIPTAAKMPQVGQVSDDGRLLYSGGGRGWVNLSHSYLIEGGHPVHMPDCLPYKAARALGGGEVTMQSGPFADHGA